ncbi:hypothetical protein ACK3TF_002179 [Chlorella vulgaris]
MASPPSPPKPASISQYEAQRAQRILDNRRKMEQMGLLEAAHGLAAPTLAPSELQPGAEVAPRLKSRKVQQAVQQGAQGPSRLSRRLRGVNALDQKAAAAEARAEAEAEGAARVRGAAARKPLVLVEGVQLSAPFSLRSIGVTVWELGQVHRGTWAQRYWSSPGCLFHHAYPVGYRATKVQFGRTYEMAIEEGAAGPLFKVTDQQSGVVFTGSSPTKPWTEICIAHRTGQRISGPLFFGFSDPLTQRAIAANLYSKEELRAVLQARGGGGNACAGREASVPTAPCTVERQRASPDGQETKLQLGIPSLLLFLQPSCTCPYHQQGGMLEQAVACQEEQAAKEFLAVEGVGEATACVLARTTALGGSRHSGPASLRAWANSSEGNSQVLFDYLTGSEEVLESARRWPAWQQRLVPKIVLALTGRWLGTGLPPNPNSELAAVVASGAATGGDATETAGGAGKIQAIGGKRAGNGPPRNGAKRVRRAAAMQD